MPGQPRLVRNGLAREQRELEAGLQVDEHHRAVVEFLPDDALGLETEPIAVEPQGPLEIVDTERDERDSRLHECISRGTGVWG
ncbi:MAG: hypothetical protein IRZ28_07235 [Steroidobacteraceae bacterium]|nr:hypothetical protein [Steroidobacteraceae bacterium]